jgi:hypothetical protein
MSKQIKFDLVIFLTLFFVVAIIGTFVDYKNLILSSVAQTTIGIVAEKFPENHLGFSFNYKVDGKNYNGSSYAGQIDRPFEKIQPGDAVTVFYDKYDPTNQTLETPKILLVRTLGQIFAASLIIPVIGLLIFRQIKSKN